MESGSEKSFAGLEKVFTGLEKEVSTGSEKEVFTASEMLIRTPFALRRGFSLCNMDLSLLVDLLIMDDKGLMF